MKLLIIIFIVCVIAFIILFNYLRRKSASRDFPIHDLEAWAKRWAELEKMLEGEQPQWSVAVIEADKLFDRVLKSMHLPGKDFGERLRFLTRSRPELQFIWPAHLIRNRLVHESDYEIEHKTALETLKTFKKGLQKLGIL